MSELPPTPPVPDSNNPAPTVTTPVTPRPGRINPIYLWRNNRWLFLVYVAVVIILLLGISLIGLLAYTQFTAQSSKTDPVPTQVPGNTPTATHKSDDDKFFAEQPLTVLYYSFAQTSGSKNMFQSTTNDRENRVLDIGYPDKYQFLTSPDGAWLLRWNEQSVERANAAKPQEFSSVFDLGDDEQKIKSVVWQADMAAIAIVSSQANGQTEDDSTQNTVTILPLVTLQPVVVYDQPDSFDLELVKFPNANSLYFVENHNGARRNLTQFNPQSKQVDRQFTGFNQNDLLSQVQFSSDMQSAFRITDTQIIRYNLQTMEQSVVYTVDRHCKIGDPNTNSIAYATVAPSGTKFVVTESLTKCLREQRSPEPTPVPPTRQTTLYSASEQKVLIRKFNLDLPQLTSSSWSPAEDYIWFAQDTQKSFIITANDLAISPMPTLTRQNITKERVFIVGWLQPKR